MEFTDIAKHRLAHQHLIGPKLASPVEVVRHLGSVQSQDYAGAKWGIAQRSATPLGEADRAVDGAITDGSIIRTHVMRPTWHFVVAEDLRELLSLTGPRVQKGNGGRCAQLGLDAKTLDRAGAVMAKALDGTSLARGDLVQVLEREKISTEGQRMPYILMYAELEQIICSGPRAGKHHTYALMDERVLRPCEEPTGRRRRARSALVAQLRRSTRFLQGLPPGRATSARRCRSIPPGASAASCDRRWRGGRRMEAQAPHTRGGHRTDDAR